MSKSSPVEFLQSKINRPFGGWPTPNLPKNPVVALSSSETESAQLAGDQSAAIDVRVALTPDAAYGFRETGTDYCAIEDFFDVTAFKVADRPMLELQSRWSDQVDEFSWQELPELKDCGLRPAGDFFFFLKHLSDMLYKAAFSLVHLALVASPSRVVYFDCKDSKSHINDTLYFADSVYSAMLPLIAEQSDIKLEQKESVARPRNVKSLSPVSALKQSLSPQTLAKMRRLQNAGIKQLSLRALGKKTGHIIYQNAYDIPFVMELMRSKGLSTQTTDELLAFTRSKTYPELDAALRKAWHQLRDNAFFIIPFNWAGTDTVSLAELQLQHWWFSVVPRMYGVSQALRRKFSPRRPKAVVISSATTPEDHALLHAARSLGTPTFTFQHGGFEGNCDYSVYDMTDLRQSDYRIAYGPLTADYFNRRANQCSKPRAKTLATGSPRLDIVSKQSEDAGQKLGLVKRRPVILYVPTIYSDNWYLSQGAYLSVPYFELLLGVVKVIQNSPNHFVYKPFPGLSNDPILKILAHDCPNCSVVQDTPASELISSCDAVVIDLPSTALLEALTTKKRIFVFSDRRYLSLRPEARELLHRRVVLCEDYQRYLTELREFVNQAQAQELPDPNDDFLLAYGTYLNDGCSAERAADLLASIIQPSS